ncbi:hypothetical protein ACWGA4_24945 [Streptomyces rubiginosohelvolus]|uniref:hypothetical protein n=1 Tax=Streptomyces sp. CB02130 TaxID=1703934 RepID=UPI0013014B5F|nr:hypothetical protein [Streptomyces sp. CB02130]
MSGAPVLAREGRARPGRSRHTGHRSLPSQASHPKDSGENARSFSSPRTDTR